MTRLQKPKTYKKELKRVGNSNHYTLHIAPVMHEPTWKVYLETVACILLCAFLAWAFLIITPDTL